MTRALLLTVRFHDGRYHGVGDWPPSPARLFQALVAGAGRGGAISEADRQALQWLETLEPPLIGAPPAREGQGFRSYVPNNDLDALGGDPARVAAVRAPKSIRPRLFDASQPFLYLWSFAGGDEEAERVAAIAAQLYQLGRGVDMAFATVEALSSDEAEARLDRYDCVRYRPSTAGDGLSLLCPVVGTLASLEVRFAAMRARFSSAKKGRSHQTLFRQPPKPRTALRFYDSPAAHYLFEFRRTESDKAQSPFAPQPLHRIVALVETIRDQAAERLEKAVPEAAQTIRRTFIGKSAAEADKAVRIRILPLPSVGHPHAEASIRRLLIEVPSNCPLRLVDVEWAFSSLLPYDRESGEYQGWSLVAAEDEGMLRRYDAKRRGGARLWRSVTPAALPAATARRRIDPCRRGDEAKGGPERAEEERAAAAAVLTALRHAGVTVRAEQVRVQREPFLARGARAEAFAPGTRFVKERLWHVEIRFAEALRGPLVIGDGRYLGLGIMAPMPEPLRRVAVFAIQGKALPATARAEVLLALRRALMALDRDAHGEVATLFSGHSADGGPSAGGHHRHVFLAADTSEDSAELSALYVLRPDVVDRSARLDPGDRRRFDRVVSALHVIRSRRYGLLRLAPLEGADAAHCLLEPSRRWCSATGYRPTRHPKPHQDAAAVVKADCVRECLRRGLPEPREVAVVSLQQGPRGGLCAQLELSFAVAIRGPVLLGRASHTGEGLFLPVA